MMVTTHFRLLPRLKVSGTISALLLYNFMVCTGTTLPVTLVAALCLTESVQLFEVPSKSWYVTRQNVLEVAILCYDIILPVSCGHETCPFTLREEQNRYLIAKCKKQQHLYLGEGNGENYLINCLVPKVDYICARCVAETHRQRACKVMGRNLNSMSFAEYSGHLIPSLEASSMMI